MTDSDFIVRVYNWWYEVDQMFDKYCILMELCDTNLADVIRLKYYDQESFFTEQEIWQITCNIMEGIQKCHDLNFTHRDLKPQNSMSPKQSFPDFSSSLFVKNENLEVERLWNSAEAPCFHAPSSFGTPESSAYTDWRIQHCCSPRYEHISHQTGFAGLRGAGTAICRNLWEKRRYMVNRLYSLRTRLR